MNSTYRYYEGQQYGDLPLALDPDSPIQTFNDLYFRLRSAWSADTAYPSCQSEWDKDDPSYGQCATTSMIVYDLFGGEIRKIVNADRSTHYFNFVDGKVIDLTSEQFALYHIPVFYPKGVRVPVEYCGKNRNTLARYKLLCQCLGIRPRFGAEG